jgi:hypothetical protein
MASALESRCMLRPHVPSHISQGVAQWGDSAPACTERACPWLKKSECTRSCSHRTPAWSCGWAQAKRLCTFRISSTAAGSAGRSPCFKAASRQRRLVVKRAEAG